MKNKLYPILTLLWMVLIFLFSNMNGNDSANVSKSFLDIFLSFLPAKFYPLAHFLIRKAAHMMEYAILYFLLYASFSKNDLKYPFIYSLLFAFSYASLDEYHQSFIAGRGPSFYDVMIDTFGAFIASGIIKIISNKCS